MVTKVKQECVYCRKFKDIRAFSSGYKDGVKIPDVCNACHSKMCEHLHGGRFPINSKENMKLIASTDAVGTDGCRATIQSFRKSE